jgi:hypothetical protein
MIKHYKVHMYIMQKQSSKLIIVLIATTLVFSVTATALLNHTAYGTSSEVKQKRAQEDIAKKGENAVVPPMSHKIILQHLKEQSAKSKKH